jgi:hypothetical protein
MFWRTLGAQRYYQHSYRDVDGRVRSRYYGRGPLAEAIASLDARERDRRIERRERTRAERERLARMESRVVEYCEGVDELFDAWMRLSGWHRHGGQWCRNGKITRRSMLTSQKMDRLIEAEKVRREFEAGNVGELIERYRGDMAINALEMIISRFTDDAAQREALRRQAARLRDQLAGPAATPIEKILAERVTVCYMDVYFSDQLAYGKAMPLIHAEFFERCRDRTHRRYLRAVKTLAECRKLETSTIQQTVERLRLVV